MKDVNLDFYTDTEATERFKDFTHAIVYVWELEVDGTVKKIVEEKLKLNMPKRRKRKSS